MTVMTRIAVTREMNVPHDRVWEAISDLGSHDRWMKDARWIVFVGDQRRGSGTRMKVKTVVGPFRLLDDMEVTRWEEGRAIEVTHRGLVTGRGTLSATATATGTKVVWDEVLTFPWWLGGGVTAWLARPVLAAVWRGNLGRLERVLTDL